MIQDAALIVFEDVEGAPVRIGAVVRIADSSLDGTFDPRFLGRTGVVVALVFDEPRLQYPADPLIQVHVHGVGEDLFFLKELELAAEWLPQRTFSGGSEHAANAEPRPA